MISLQTKYTQPIGTRSDRMIEYRLSDDEAMKLPEEPLLAEFALRLKLSAASFDMKRILDITMDRDVANGEFIYRQKEDIKND